MLDARHPSAAAERRPAVRAAVATLWPMTWRKAGAQVVREQPAAARPRGDRRGSICGMLMSFLAASGFQPEVYAGAQKAAAAQLDTSDMSLAAERLRGIVLSHRDWVIAERRPHPACARNGASCSRSIDAVICPVMPIAGLSRTIIREDQEKRHIVDRRQGIIVYPDQLAWPGIATLPGLPATAIPTVTMSAEGLPIGAADRRAVAGGPHTAQARRTDRAVPSADSSRRRCSMTSGAASLRQRLRANCLKFAQRNPGCTPSILSYRT